MSQHNANILFFASSAVSIPCISLLVSLGRLAGVVVTNPDSPDGQQLQAFLQQHQLPTFFYNAQQLEKLLSAIQNSQATMGIIFTFPYILPESLIERFQFGLFNIHASALPNYRGLMPIYWQLRHNREDLTLTLHKVEKGVDSGDIGAQINVPVHPYDNYQTLHFSVMEVAPTLLQQSLPQIESGSMEWQPQRALTKQDFYARKVQPSDAIADWSCNAQDFVAAARAGNPHFGGVSIAFNGGYIQVMQASQQTMPCSGVKPGTIVSVSKEQGLWVATQKGCVSLDVIVSQAGYFSGYTFAVRHRIDAGMMLSEERVVI